MRERLPGKQSAGAVGGMSPGRASLIPPRQQPHETAFNLGFDILLSKQPSAEKLKELGAEQKPEGIRVPALNRHLLVDLANREVFVENGGRAKRTWALLVLHYLCAEDVSIDTREVSLGHFPDCRGYLDVFGKRIIGRFLATTGRTSERFSQASEQLGATHLGCPGVCYRFDVLPRVPVAIARFEGDEELGPGANVIYRADANRLLPAEDCIVAAELLLDVLSGKSMEAGSEG